MNHVSWYSVTCSSIPSCCQSVTQSCDPVDCSMNGKLFWALIIIQHHLFLPNHIKKKKYQKTRTLLFSWSPLTAMGYMTYFPPWSSFGAHSARPSGSCSAPKLCPNSWVVTRSASWRITQGKRYFKHLTITCCGELGSALKWDLISQIQINNRAIDGLGLLLSVIEIKWNI